MIDILRLYNERKISIKKMNKMRWSEIKDEVSGANRYYTQKELGVNDNELKAMAFAVPIQRVALWHQLGWENHCWNCFQEIDIDNGIWRGGAGFLKHIGCIKRDKARRRMYIKALKMKERYVKHKGHYREL